MTKSEIKIVGQLLMQGSLHICISNKIDMRSALHMLEEGMINILPVNDGRRIVKLETRKHVYGFDGMTRSEFIKLI